MPSKVNCMVSKIHNTVVIVYKGLRLNLKFMALRFLRPINAPTALKIKAHSLAMSRVSNGNTVVPSWTVSLPLVTSINRNKPKARAR